MTGEVDPPASSDASAATPASAQPSAVGRMLAGRYRLQRVLGEGGMAIVYEGEHATIGKRVAIKLVHSLFAKDDDIVDRFEREARSASAVESEHIVHVFDVGNDPDLGLFLVMELLTGQDLGHVLSRRGRLDAPFACGLVKQAALGLEKAHAAGIVHRDLKPANVFLVDRDDGTTLVKLVDFGIAKVLREAQDARFARKGITRRGVAIGTPQYMSPEQAQGLESVDHRTDVYSLGTVLFEAIAGRQCVEERATWEQTILHLVGHPAPRLSAFAPEVPEALDRLVADMLDHDIARRVPDMRTVRERLEAVYPELRGSSVRLRSLPPSSSEPSLERYVVHADAGALHPTVPGAHAPPLRRRPVALVASLAAALGVSIGLLAMFEMRPSVAEPVTATAPPGAGVVASASPAAASRPPAAPLEPAPAWPDAAPPPAIGAPAPAAPATAATAAGGSARPGHAPAPRTTAAAAAGQVGAAGISSAF